MTNQLVFTAHYICAACTINVNNV